MMLKQFMRKELKMKKYKLLKVCLISLIISLCFSCSTIHEFPPIDTERHYKKIKYNNIPKLEVLSLCRNILENREYTIAAYPVKDFDELIATKLFKNSPQKEFHIHILFRGNDTMILQLATSEKHYTKKSPKKVIEKWENADNTFKKEIRYFAKELENQIKVKKGSIIQMDLTL